MFYLVQSKCRSRDGSFKMKIYSYRKSSKLFFSLLYYPTDNTRPSDGTHRVAPGSCAVRQYSASQSATLVLQLFNFICSLSLLAGILF